MSRFVSAVMVAGVAGVAAQASAAPIEVIFTKIAGHPTAVVPGALDLSGMPVFTEFRAMEDFAFSPDGTKWVLKGRNQLGGDLETTLLMGSGLSGTTFQQEGQPIPGGVAGELYDFFGSGLGRWNEMGKFAYSARSRGGPASTFQKVIVWDGVGFTTPFQMGDPLEGLMDLAPSPSGDELIGNSIGSIHILNDGRIGSQDSTIQNIHSSRRPAIFYNASAFHQTNVTTVTGISGPPSIELWKTLSINGFYTTPDGAHWFALGQVNQPTTMDSVMVYDGRVVLQEGVAIPGGTLVPTTIVNVDMAANGHWFARGAAGTTAYAIRNGALLAQTGDPIFAGSSENWSGSSFLTFTGNRVGDYIVVGTTSSTNPAADQVIVYNGGRVLVREGDPVDLNGNGMFDDDVFIGRGNNTLVAFDANDVFIADNGDVYFIANIRDGAGNDLNSNPVFGTPQAFFRIRAACPGDANHDGGVNFADLNLVLSNFGMTGQPGFVPGDVNRDGVVNFADLNLVLSFFGQGC